MKKFFYVLILSLIATTAVFADGLTGIFGIDWGKSSAEVKTAMEAKGWELSRTTESEQYYKKTGGSYANLPVKEINVSFYEDRFYRTSITFLYNTNLDEVANAVKVIKESCNLTFENKDYSNPDEDGEILNCLFRDPHLNEFVFCAMGYKSFTGCLFYITNSSIKSEKNRADEKKKAEETEAKNKIISSDL